MESGGEGESTHLLPRRRPSEGRQLRGNLSLWSHSSSSASRPCRSTPSPRCASARARPHSAALTGSLPQICSHLDPGELLRLAQTSRLFRNVLLSASQSISQIPLSRSSRSSLASPPLLHTQAVYTFSFCTSSARTYLVSHGSVYPYTRNLRRLGFRLRKLRSSVPLRTSSAAYLCSSSHLLGLFSFLLRQLFISE